MTEKVVGIIGGVGPEATVDLYKKIGEPVIRGEALYAIHAEFAADFDFACEAAAQNNGFTLAD